MVNIHIDMIITKSNANDYGFAISGIGHRNFCLSLAKSLPHPPLTNRKDRTLQANWSLATRGFHPKESRLPRSLFHFSPSATLISCTCYIYKGLKHAQNSDQLFLFNAAEREAYLNLKRFLQSPHDIVEVFKKLIFAEDSTYSKDGQKDTIFTNKLVSSIKPYDTLLGSNLLFKSNYLVLCE